MSGTPNRLRLLPASLVAVALLRAAPAAAQDIIGLFGEGAEAQAHAGAGVLAARNAPADYYDPANLTATAAGVVPYLGFDFVDVDYTYTYPDKPAVAVRQASPLPFLGVTWRPKGSDLAFAASLLPVPASAGKVSVDNLPSKEFAGSAADEPVLLDVTSGGAGTGERASLGAALKLGGGWSVGVSIIRDDSGSSLVAKEADNGNELIEVNGRTESTEALLGARVAAERLTAGLAVAPMGYARSSEHTALPAFGPTAVANRYSSSHLPVTVAAGASYALLGGPFLVPYVEVKYTGWRALAQEKGSLLLGEEDVAQRDTFDYALGADVASGPHRWTLAYAMHPSHLGDGVMASEAPDHTEVLGLQFQNVDAVPLATFAAGYGHALGSGKERDGSLEVGLSYASGARDVAYSARGYGRYALTIITAIFGGSWQF